MEYTWGYWDWATDDVINKDRLVQMNDSAEVTRFDAAYEMIINNISDGHFDNLLTTGSKRFALLIDDSDIGGYIDFPAGVSTPTLRGTKADIDVSDLDNGYHWIRWRFIRDTRLPGQASGRQYSWIKKDGQNYLTFAVDVDWNEVTDEMDVATVLFAHAEKEENIVNWS